MQPRCSKSTLVLFRTVVAACVAPLIFLGACDPAEPPDERQVIRIFAVSELEDLVHEMRSDFVATRPDVRVEISTGDTQSLALQSAAGDKPDLFITNDSEVYRSMTPPPGSVTRWITDDLVVISSERGVTMGDFARDDGPVSIVMESSPAGASTRLALQIIDVWSSVELRGVRTQSMDEVVSRVRSGDARFGVAYASSVAGENDRISVVGDLRLPDETAMAYFAGWFTESGRSFYDWMLQSEEAARHVEAAGFRATESRR